MRVARLTKLIVGLSVGCALALGVGLAGASPALAKDRGATTTTAKAKMSAAAKKKAKAIATAKAQANAKARAKAVARAKAKAAAVARWKRATGAAPLAAKTARIAAAARVKTVKAYTKASRDRAKALTAARSARAAKARSSQAAAKKATRSLKKARARARKSAAKAAKVNAAYRAKALIAARAQAAAGPASGWAPRNRTVFNDPMGSTISERAIIQELATAIDATPVGAEIYMAQYLFDIPVLTAKLIAAHRRGVYVRILIDAGEHSREIRQLRKVLGTNKKARSFVAKCRYGCMAGKPSKQHAKFYLFSVAGARGRAVSMISSANPYVENVYNSWNNHHTIVGDVTIYRSLRTYFIDMLADRTNRNYFRVTGSGKYRLYLYPRKARRPEDIVVLRALNQVSCQKTKKGYGTKSRKTMVRVANWGWTGARIDVAKRLWRLHDKGCKVQVMINSGRIAPNVLSTCSNRAGSTGGCRSTTAGTTRTATMSRVCTCTTR